jgi:hypothetical protein
MSHAPCAGPWPKPGSSRSSPATFPAPRVSSGSKRSRAWVSAAGRHGSSCCHGASGARLTNLRLEDNGACHCVSGHGFVSIVCALLVACAIPGLLLPTGAGYLIWSQRVRSADEGVKKGSGQFRTRGNLRVEAARWADVRVLCGILEDTAIPNRAWCAWSPAAGCGSDSCHAESRGRHSCAPVIRCRIPISAF